MIIYVFFDFLIFYSSFMDVLPTSIFCFPTKRFILLINFISLFFYSIKFLAHYFTYNSRDYILYYSYVLVYYFLQKFRILLDYDLFLLLQLYKHHLLNILLNSQNSKLLDILHICPIL